MAKLMKQITAISFLMYGLFGAIHKYIQAEWSLSCLITFGTITYHFGMRFLVGYIFNECMNNKADYSRKWYQLKNWESRLYEIIKVKKWKMKMPTYQPDLFSPKEHTWDEIAQAMCQAELVHETIIIFSFLPVAASVVWDSFWAFFITSVLASMIDLSFVIIQRYNRPRVVKIAMKENRNGKDKK